MNADRHPGRRRKRIDPPASSARPAPTNGGKLWLFRLGLLALVLLGPIAILELGLRLAGYGFPTGFFLRETSTNGPALVENPRFAFRFFPPRLARVPQPLRLPRQRPTNTIRIVVLGESAVMGDPMPAFGPPRILKALLEGRYPGRKFEVVNVAMTAINSHAILPIARDCTPLAADIWLVYAGNNEVMGPYGPGAISGTVARNLTLVRAGLALKTTRTGQLFGTIADRLSSSKPVPENWAGLELFVSRQIRADDPQLDYVAANFEQNLRDIIAAGWKARAQIILSTVAVNLADSAPFRSASNPALTSSALAEWQMLLATAKEHVRAGSKDEAIAAYRKAEPLDPVEASLQFALGRLQLAQGQTNEARRRFELARDQDTLRFRTDSRLNEIIRRVATASASAGVRLLEADSAFAAASTNGTPGREFFWEHVHFNFEGGYLLARLLAEEIAQALPAEFSANASPAWLSTEQCARELGFTDWHRARLIETVRARLARSPFTEQANAGEREAELQRQLVALRPASQPTAFELHAATMRAAIAKRPDDWTLHDQFASLLEAFGDQDGAIAEWETVLRLMPRHMMANFQLGRLLTRPGSLEAAERHLRAALAVRAEFPEALNQLGQVLGHARRLDESARAFARAVELNPDYAEAQVNWALSLAAAGQTNAALARLEAAARRDTNSVLILQNLGKLLIAAGQTPRALEHLQEIVRLRPNNAAARFQLAEACQAVGQTDAAAQAYLATLKLNPDHLEARFKLGLEFARLRRDVEAAEQFREVIRRRPDSATAHLNLGIALLGQGQPEEALTAFDRALELEPNNEKTKAYIRSVRARLPP